MGTLTLTELLNEVSNAHASRADFTQAEQIVALNLSAMRITRLKDFNELQSINTGTIGQSTPVPATDKFFTLPTGVRRFHSIKIVDSTSKSDSRKLKFVQQRLWDTAIPETEAYDTNTPTHYTIWDKKMETWPIADKAYSIELRSTDWPADFVAASMSAKSDLDHKDDMIIALAVSWGFLRFREMEEANRWFVIFKDMMKSALDQDMQEFEHELKPSIEQFMHGSPGNDPWKDPFNRTGVR